MRGAEAERLRADFEAWRSADPANSAAYAEVETLWRRTGALADTAVGRNRQLPRKRIPFLQLPFARPALAALGGVVAIGLAFALLGASSFGPTTTMIAASAAPLTSKVGEIRTVRLEDGSRVTLDTDSAIEVAMTRDVRNVRLTRGRARFDVVADHALPFRVEAGGRTVTAVGTVFDVGYDGEGIRVALLRGTAEVAGVTAGGRPVIAHLKAGECLANFGRAAQVTRAAAGADQWPSGMLSFDAVPLAEVVAQTNRYSARKIRLKTPALGSLRVTGVFRPVPVDALASSLAAAFALRVEETPNGDFLLGRKVVST